MKATEAIRQLMKQKGIGATRMSRILEVSAPRVVTDRLAQSNLSMKLADQMLKVLGYRIVFLPEDSPLPEDGIEING